MLVVIGGFCASAMGASSLLHRPDSRGAAQAVRRLRAARPSTEANCSTITRLSQGLLPTERPFSGRKAEPRRRLPRGSTNNGVLALWPGLGSDEPTADERQQHPHGQRCRTSPVNLGRVALHFSRLIGRSRRPSRARQGRGRSARAPSPAAAAWAADDLPAGALPRPRRRRPRAAPRTS